MGEGGAADRLAADLGATPGAHGSESGGGRNRPLPPAGLDLQRAGLRARLVDARQAARDGKLHLICAATVIPPVFEIEMWEGQQAIDSGMADKAPMPQPSRGRTLMLLTAEFRNTPLTADRLYAAPSRGTPADKIDFTDPEKLRQTWGLGRRDGERFLERHGIGPARQGGDEDGESCTGDGGLARDWRGHIQGAAGGRLQGRGELRRQ